MPFGLQMSQDIVQTKIDHTFEGCEGVAGIADDIVVFGTTSEEHDRNMHGMLRRCQMLCEAGENQILWCCL